MHIILAWASLGLAIAACIVLAIIQVKRSAWWGPRRSVLEALDEKEVRIGKYAGVLFILTIIVGLVAASFYWSWDKEKGSVRWERLGQLIE